MPPHHGRRSSTQLTLQAAFLQTALAVPPTAAGPIDVVDLFCGVGGFSEGARQAGHRVVLAVDSNTSALDAHKLNHPLAVHELAILPAENLQQLLPSAGAKWHLHGSPPCTKLSRAGGTNRSKGRICPLPNDSVPRISTDYNRHRNVTKTPPHRASTSILHQTIPKRTFLPPKCH